jgi:outer membrane protein assembly factor BamD
MKNRGVIKRPGEKSEARLSGRSSIWGGLAVLILALACATAPAPDEIPSAESYYRRGLEVLEGRRVLLFFHDVDYARAIELFQEVIDNYPYSDYATLAELKIADVYFEQERFEEAASYYQDFVELHPSHPRISYAIYRRGLCASEEMRGGDRDQTPTREAVAQFRFLLDRHPESEYAEDARARLAEAEDLLATHLIDVADFYFQRQRYFAAASRYREALESYPQHQSRQRTRYRLALSLRALGEEREAREILEQILRDGEDPDLTEKVEDALRELENAHAEKRS